MTQEVLYASDNYKELDDYFIRNDIHAPLLVCGDSLKYLRINDYINGLKKRIGIDIVKFSDFKPNPLYESVIEGIRVFKDNDCDSIVAIGGGSSIDVAKCIKLYGSYEGDGANGGYLTQSKVPNDIRILAIPTTAGTGSEVTRYAVIYYEGKKQSVTDDSIVPGTVLFDDSFISKLPRYQRISTMMDALCHGIESFWSVNSTDESKAYSRKSIELIVQNYQSYLDGDESKNHIMQEAAYIAGKAINITQTTAGHAMCYGLTSKFGLSHGHAASLCVRELWPWMIKGGAECLESRGIDYLSKVFRELAMAFGCEKPDEGYQKFRYIIDGFEELEHPVGGENDFDELSKTVNVTRLSNHPMRLSTEDIRKLYSRIIRLEK